MRMSSPPSRTRKRPARAGAWALTALALWGLSGCATSPAANPPNPADPWEGLNRKVFAFNEGVDEHVLKPVATTYVKVVPQFMRTGVNNFFGNFSDAWSAVNSFLQGKGEEGFNGIMRVGTNTVFGIFGLFDVASEAGIERHGEDFGQTLGVWGLPAGPYVVWPVLGPSSVRDSVAMPLNLAAEPSAQLRSDAGAQWGVSLLQLVSVRANLLGATGVLEDVALDRYTFMRDAYLQRRRSLVYDGDPPEQAPEPEESEAPAANKP